MKLHYAKSDPIRSFFPSESAAKKALAHIQAQNEAANIRQPYKTEIRWLDTRSTDVGLMQINYLFHGRHFDNIESLLEPEINVHYAARHLKKLFKRHGNLGRAVAYYHSNTPEYQNTYLALFWPAYKKLVLSN